MSEFGFETTRWSVILASTDKNRAKARAALDSLCQTYYPPVHAFIRSWVGSNDIDLKRFGGRSALDLTHDFFVEFLEEGVGTPSSEKGRFRSYLLGRVKHFLSRVVATSGAAKRGGNISIVPLDTPIAGNLPAKGAESFPSDAWFDRRWAETTIAEALGRVKKETSFPPELVDRIVGEIPKELREKLATKYEMSDAAVKVAVCRLRKSFRLALRQVVAETLSLPIGSPDTSPEEIEKEVEKEIDYLAAALAER